MISRLLCPPKENPEVLSPRVYAPKVIKSH